MFSHLSKENCTIWGTQKLSANALSSDKAKILSSGKELTPVLDDTILAFPKLKSFDGGTYDVTQGIDFVFYRVKNE